MVQASDLKDCSTTFWPVGMFQKKKRGEEKLNFIRCSVKCFVCVCFCVFFCVITGAIERKERHKQRNQTKLWKKYLETGKSLECINYFSSQFLWAGVGGGGREEISADSVDKKLV